MTKCYISSSNHFPLNGGFKINGQGREKGFGTPINFETPIRGIFCNVICNVIYSIRPALEHELQHYFLHKEFFRTLRTTSTAGVNNFLWWIEWGLRNWPDQTKTKNTNQNTNKYMFKRVCVLKCVHQEDQPHCKNNVYNYIYIILCIRKMHTNTIYYIKYDLIILNYINSIIYIIWNINQWPMSPISRPQNVPRVKTKHQLKRQNLHKTSSWGTIPQIKTSKRT